MPRRPSLLLLLASLAGCPAPAPPPATPEAPSSGVLLVLAHPDDETMLGATLARLKERRVPVDAIYATRGEGGKLVVLEDGRPVETDPDDAQLARLRTAEMAAAARHYGIRRHLILEQPDQPFEDPVTHQPTEDVRRFLDSKVWDVPALEQAITRFAAAARPDVVITLGPDARRTHAHHQAIGRIAQRLFEQRRFGPQAIELHAVDEVAGCGGSSTMSHAAALRVSRRAYSAALKQTYGAFQHAGRRLHRSQLVAHKPAAAHDEVLVPLARRGAGGALLRALLGVAEDAPRGHS